MRTALLCSGFVVAFLGCSSSTSPAVDAAVTIDGSVSDAGGVDTSECSNVVHQDVSSAMVEGLSKAIGLWKWSKQVEGSKETDLDKCDSSIAYRFGPEAFVPPSNATTYAKCILARGGIVELSSGSINRPAGQCPALSCPPSKYGLLWGSDTSGSVFELDADGKPHGMVVFAVRFVGKDLLWSTIGGGQSGYRMELQGGNDSLACH